MNRTILVQDPGGVRNFKSEDYPLAVCGTTRAEIHSVESGLHATSALAFLGLSNGRPFVQPASENIAVHCNNSLLTGSRWIEDGDKLRCGTVAITCRVSSTQLVYELNATNPNSESQLIIEPPPSEGETIEPIAYRSSPPPPPHSGRRRSVVTVVLTLVLASLALVAWFVFTAKSVAIKVDPIPESLELSGRLPTFKLADRYLARPGSYRVLATKRGYQHLEQTIEISDDASQVRSFTMEKLPGLLSISTRPVDGVEVKIDGEAAGITPLSEVELKPGTHEILALSDRYLEYRTDVLIEGRSIKQQLEIELTPRWSAITFKSNPMGASVLIDGQHTGATPFSTDLLAGSYEVEFRKDGYEPWRTSLEVAANEPKELPEVMLEEAAGILLLRSVPTEANVTVDREYRGQTPLDLSVPPNQSTIITLSKMGYESTSRTLELKPAQQENLRIELTPKQGRLRVKSLPADAVLYIDGQPRGKANQSVTLTAIPHTIEIKKKGYAGYSTTITPRVGFPQEISVELQKVGSAKVEPKSGVITTSEGHELRLINPGRFTMGASRREQGRRANESLRPVTLTRPFFLGVKEVTNKQFRRFLASHSSGTIQRFSLDGDDRPVVQITWEQAARYTNWLNAKESLPPAYIEKGDTLVAVDPIPTSYRLPTEAEWAWSARFAGRASASKYPWGASFPPTLESGNYADVSAQLIVANTLSEYDDHYPVTAPVARFKPNGLGLYDLGGNVAEWCHDYYTIYPSGETKAVNDPLGPKSGKHHVIRGSSWRQASISALRLTYRDYAEKGRPDVGFRIARYAE